jgi:protein SCO1
MNRPTLNLLAVALLAGCGSESTPPAPGSSEPPLAGARIGGTFTLVNQDGATVTDRSFAGRYRIMYFGYTFCPDVCPVDLQVIARGLRVFEGRNKAAADRIQPIMVTVDPERDTPPVLKQYVAAFHPRLVGLTGTPEQIAATAKAYGVYFARREAEGEAEYLMDHSNQAYLMSPDNAPLALLPTDRGEDAVAGELAKWVR